MTTLDQTMDWAGLCPVCGDTGFLPAPFAGEARGRRWLTDGVVLFRGAWPGEHDVREGNPPVEELLADLDHVVTPVTVESRRECAGQDLIRLSSGADVSAEWWPELTEGRDLLPYHEGGKTAIVFRDAAGAIAAVLMPVIASDAQTPAAS